MSNLDKALLRLFNGVYVKERYDRQLGTPRQLARTLKHGYILQPDIIPTLDTLDTIESVIGINGEKANAAFHKSWRVIEDTPQEVLWLQALEHYITTYGFEWLGVYNDSTVYIPDEVLDLPNVRLADMPIAVVKAMNRLDIVNAFIKIATSGIALSEQTLDDLMTIVKSGIIDFSVRGIGEFDKVSNRELKARMRDFYNIVPSDPVEFLRYVVSRLTGESLLIKNRYLIDKIKEADGYLLDKLMSDAPNDLPSIFFRYKPLFLAMKKISHDKGFYNRMRKAASAKWMHEPLGEDYLNSVTAQIKHRQLNLATLKRKLKDATIWRKIRLAYALKYRLNNPGSIVYRVRNGRGWVDNFEWDDKHKYATGLALTVVLDSIVDDLKKQVNGKTFFIPPNVSYTLPATEKQFTGNLPTGSYVTVPQDLIVGIHWTDTDRGRVDIDLSTVSIEGKIGWDRSYRSGRSDVLFSGDVTSAPYPKGATELFYMKQAQPQKMLLMANYFNYRSNDPVTCKLLAAHEKPENFGNNYMVDVNNIVAQANIEISQRQSILGLLAKVDGQQRVYFANVAIGNAISSSSSEMTSMARNYLVSSVVNSIELAGVLSAAGAKIVNERPQEGEYVDLSPEALDKTTFIRLMTGEL